MTSPIEIYLSSQYATTKFNGTSNSDMTFLFTSPIIPPLNHNMTLRLKNIYLPLSMYIINETNNVLVIDTSTYILSEGNYNANTLKTELSSKLGVNYTITYNNITNKLTFTNSLGNFTIQSTSTCLRILGFLENISYSSVANSLTSIYPIDLTGDNIVYISVPNLKTFNLSSKTSTQTSIISSLLVEVPYGSVLYYENPVLIGSVIQEDHISFIHVRVYGEDENTLLNLENAEWSITLEIGFIPKMEQPTISNSMKDIYKNYIESLINKDDKKQ